MGNSEVWNSHPTRKNIFLDQKTGLLYRRLEGDWFDIIPHNTRDTKKLERNNDN